MAGPKAPIALSRKGALVSAVQRRAEWLADRVFLGGPTKDFDRIGRMSLIALLEEGLTPNSRVLDVGCGCLRVGYWLLHFLASGCYYGIEPNREMLQAGLDYILEPGLAESTHPQFAHNDDFDLTVFGREFDYVLARSVWSHASKSQIVQMLDGFAAIGTDRAVFLASILPARRIGRRFKDYQGSQWVGRSHTSDVSGLVAHDMKWVSGQCQDRGLQVERVRGRTANGQVWIRITRA